MTSIVPEIMVLGKSGELKIRNTGKTYRFDGRL